MALDMGNYGSNIVYDYALDCSGYGDNECYGFGARDDDKESPVPTGLEEKGLGRFSQRW